MSIFPKNWFGLRKQQVTIILNCGEKVRFFASEITATKSNNNLSGIETVNARDFPLYTRLDDVSAIQCRMVMFWRSAPNA